jgi:hypothetical protein
MLHFYRSLPKNLLLANKSWLLLLKESWFSKRGILIFLSKQLLLLHYKRLKDFITINLDSTILSCHHFFCKRIRIQILTINIWKLHSFISSESGFNIHRFQINQTPICFLSRNESQLIWYESIYFTIYMNPNPTL